MHTKRSMVTLTWSSLSSLLYNKSFTVVNIECIVPGLQLAGWPLSILFIS